VSEPRGADDLLTRTTLQIDGQMSVPAIELAVRALQRVPGVLVAAMDAAAARVVVSHDAGVPAASLLAAVAGSGLRAKFVCDTRAPAIQIQSALGTARPPNRTLVAVAAAIFVPVAFAVTFIPGLANNHWLMPAAFVTLWALVFAQMLLARRR
jgi:hypothetical protein